MSWRFAQYQSSSQNCLKSEPQVAQSRTQKRRRNRRRGALRRTLHVEFMDAAPLMITGQRRQTNRETNEDTYTERYRQTERPVRIETNFLPFFSAALIQIYFNRRICRSTRKRHSAFARHARHSVTDPRSGERILHEHLFDQPAVSHLLCL